MPDSDNDRERSYLYAGGQRLPIPDPTPLTTAAIAELRAIVNTETAALKEIISTRLNGMDKAQEKFEANLQRVPSETDRAVKQLREVIDQSFLTVEARFEAADSAVKAALAAAKEVIAVQQRSGADAIDKADRATAKQLDQMLVLFQSATEGLEGKISDIKERLTIIESIKIGSGEQRSATQGAQIQWVGIIGLIFGGIFGVGGIIMAITADDASPPPQIVERVIERSSGPSTVIERPNQVVVPEGAQ